MTLDRISDISLVTIGACCAVAVLIMTLCLIFWFMGQVVDKFSNYISLVTRLNKRCDRYEEALHTLGLPLDTIEAIIPGTVEHMTSHDNCADHEERCMITFTVDTTELHKDFYGGGK